MLINFIAPIDIIYDSDCIVTLELAQITVTVAAMRNEFSQDGNRRDVYVRTRCSRRKGRQEVFQERELFARLNGRGSSKGGSGRSSSRYIDRSAIPHFKGKISVYSARLLSHGIIRRSSPRG